MPRKSMTRPTRVTASAPLKRHAIFGKLSPNHLKELGALATRQTIGAGKTIFAKGDPGSAMYSVDSGTVKITVPAMDGGQDRVNVLQPGEIFGEFALFDGQRRSTDAQAGTDCELWVIKRSDFQSFLQDEPKAALKLIELLGAQLSIANLHYEEVVTLTLPTRLARTLLLLADEAPARDGRLKLKQHELAQIVRTTRESVNKYLRSWAKRKWIKLERGGLTLLDTGQLAAVARGADDDGKMPKWRRGGLHRLWT
jgi:CRP/FNR family cyclic AMP-dependent transcriptional regulator